MENQNELEELEHSGVLGMKWGIRRYQNKDGSLTALGRKHYGNNPENDGALETKKNKESTAGSAEPSEQKTPSPKKPTLKERLAKVDTMDDKELSAAIDRIRKEQTYIDLVNSVYGKPEKQSTVSQNTNPQQNQNQNRPQNQNQNTQQNQNQNTQQNQQNQNRNQQQNSNQQNQNQNRQNSDDRGGDSSNKNEKKSVVGGILKDATQKSLETLVNRTMQGVAGMAADQLISYSTKAVNNMNYKKMSENERKAAVIDAFIKNTKANNEALTYYQRLESQGYKNAIPKAVSDYFSKTLKDNSGAEKYYEQASKSAGGQSGNQNNKQQKNNSKK